MEVHEIHEKHERKTGLRANELRELKRIGAGALWLNFTWLGPLLHSFQFAQFVGLLFLFSGLPVGSRVED
jgi:hypothetical protein